MPRSFRLTLFTGGAVLWLALLTAGPFVHHEGLTLGVYVLALGLAPTAFALTFSDQRAKLVAGLRRSQQQVAVMASSADELPWECDPRGNFTFAGELFAAHFGYQQHEVVSLNLRSLINPQDGERLEGLLERGVGWQQERWRCVQKDGSERWFAGSAVPNLAPDGTLLGFTGSCHPLGKDGVHEQRLLALADSICQRLSTPMIEPVFQPILSVDTGRLIGAEALSRFPGSERTPEQWFTDAADVGLSVELELAALTVALAAATQLPDDIYLSVNVGPVSLIQPEVLLLLTTAAISPDRIVLEITEHTSITNYDQLLPAVDALRAAGIRLAVDDAGAGYASFRHILRLAPEFIKLDRSLIAGIHNDPARRALAAAVVMFGLEMDATIVAEGVETPEELRCAQTLGIDAAQGYLFGRPTADWTTWNEWQRHGPLYSVSAAHGSRP